MLRSVNLVSLSLSGADSLCSCKPDALRFVTIRKTMTYGGCGLRRKIRQETLECGQTQTINIVMTKYTAYYFAALLLYENITICAIQWDFGGVVDSCI